MWKKKLRAKATYGCLLKALLNGKCASGAVKKIVDILNNPGPDITAEVDHSSTTSSGKLLSLAAMHIQCVGCLVLVS